MDISKSLNGFVNKAAVIILLLFIIKGQLFSQSGVADIPRIKWLSVDVYTGEIKLEYEKSTTPGVQSYTVKYQRRTGSSTIISFSRVSGLQNNAADDPFFTIDPDLIDADIYTKPIAFAVEAHKAVFDSTSDVDKEAWDSTICLKAEYDTCLASLILEWNRYDFNMWEYGLSRYRVYLSQNGGDYTIRKTIYIGERDTIPNLLPNSNYSVYVAAFPAYPALQSDSATSIVRTFNTFSAQLPEYIYADYATYNGGNAEINFTIDPQNELHTFNLLRSGSPEGPFDSIARLSPVNNSIVYTDNVDYLSGPYYYKLEAVNYCKIPVLESENTASTIVLKNEGEPLIPELSWNEYFEWIGGVEYNIERKFGNTSYESIAQISTTNYTDTEIETLAGTGVDNSVCYRITALEQANINGKNAQSVSNEVCFDLPLNIRFEFDAFMPGSNTYNNSFGPTIDYLPDDFTFEILDRSGSVVYRTTDPLNCRWDGRINNSLAPGGAYMYVLQYQNRGGKRHVLRGGVAVVYP